MKTSVASVTFREKNKAEVAELARRAGLDAIEWGGDIHVPPGDIQAAQNALRITKDNGLTVSAYGSYYAAGTGESFAPVLKTARILECPVIRVWAGRQASTVCTSEERRVTVAQLARAVEMAADAGFVVATEYHANTLTDTLDSTLTLLQQVPGLHTLWQPPVGVSEADNLLAIRSLNSRIENLHVYHRSKNGARRPLAEGADSWRSYFAMAGSAHYATLEFVMEDSEQQFLQDAAQLHALLRGEIK